MLNIHSLRLFFTSSFINEPSPIQMCFLCHFVLLYSAVCALCFMHSAELFLFFSSLSSFLLFHVCIYGFLKSHFFLFSLFQFLFYVVLFFALRYVTRQLSLIGFLCWLCERHIETLCYVWDGLRATCRNFSRNLFIKSEMKVFL